MDFKKWCYSISKNTKSKADLTHIFIDGGSASIQADKMDEFYKYYISNINENNKFSLVEIKTKIFKFFIDIDFEHSFELDFDSKIQLTKQIISLIKEIIYFKDEGKYDCIISFAENQIKNGKVKNGIHINFTNIYVNKDYALKIRDILIQGLINSDDHYLNWNEIIDDSVYNNGTGLRVMYSNKLEKCIECPTKSIKKNKKDCKECIGTGNNFSRPYFPIMKINSDIKEIFNYPTDYIPTIEDMYDFSIRTIIKDINIFFNEPYPSWYNPNVDFKIDEEKHMRLGKNYEKISETTELFIELQNYLREYWEIYKNIKITALYRFISGSTIKYCFRSNAKYCHNIKTTHKSNHVWFVFDKYRDEEYIKQKCFDITCKSINSNKITSYITPIGKSIILSEKIKNIIHPKEIKPEIKKIQNIGSKYINDIISEENNFN